MLQRFLLIALTLCSLTASAQWQQTGSKVRYVNGLGIPTKDTAAGVAADSSQILIRPADSSLYVKYKRTWMRVGGGGGSIAGSGTTNYVPKFTASGFIGNSQIFDNGTSVGIGTTSPAYPLQVRRAGGAGSLGISIDNVVGTDRAVQYFAIQDVAAGSGSGHAFYYRAQGSTTDVLGFVLDENGSFGIGTASPWERLSIPFNSKLSFGDSTYPLSISRSNAGNLITTISDNYDVSNTRIDFVMRNGSVNQNTPLSLLSTGNVGIGYTAPAAKLAVSGTTLINTNTDNGTDKLQVSGSIDGTGFKQAYTAKTGTYTATTSDYVIDCTSGTFTVNLFTAVGNTGRILIIKNSGAGTITVDPNGTQTIDGSTTYILEIQYETLQIISDGTNWKIISN